jgi:hypothetical protein
VIRPGIPRNKKRLSSPPGSIIGGKPHDRLASALRGQVITDKGKGLGCIERTVTPLQVFWGVYWWSKMGKMGATSPFREGSLSSRCSFPVVWDMEYFVLDFGASTGRVTLSWISAEETQALGTI